MPKLFSGLALVAVLVLTGCRTAPLYDVTNIAFTTPPTSVKRVLTINDYKDAIIIGGSKRNWTFEDAGPGHLIGSVRVRGKHSATVDIMFDTAAFSITHKSSQNLNYSADRREIHPNYNSWIHLLEQDIQAEITRMKAS
jgi:hypothetical protein